LNASLDAQLVADSIAMNLERRGSLKFKLIAYRMLKDIMNAGAMGAELVLSGKLPSDRARTWRFAQGYLKKTGEPAKVVNRAMAQAKTISGVVGIKVSILPPDAHIHDRIIIDEKLRNQIRVTINEVPEKHTKEDTKEKKDVKKKVTINKQSFEKNLGAELEKAEKSEEDLAKEAVKLEEKAKSIKGERK